MTEQRKTPTQAPQQADQGLRQQFEAELQQLQHAQRAPAGAQAFPSASKILQAVMKLLERGGLKDQLWEVYQELFGNPTSQPPAPPPEPAS